MRKKILITLFCFLFVVSCGKKGDPEYKADSNRSIKINI